MENYYYSTRETARLLNISSSRVRQMLGAGELPAIHDEETGAWKIEAHSVNALRDKRRRSKPPKSSSKGLTPDTAPAARRAQQAPANDELLASLIQDLRRLERERGEIIGELRYQRELTARAESSNADRDSLEAELLTARARVEELERERNRGFWFRLFGGRRPS